jgi:Flp pilus assembly pilin Flp
MGVGFGTIVLAACKLLIRKQQRKLRFRALRAVELHRGGKFLPVRLNQMGGNIMRAKAISLWREDSGQDIAEYAVMLAVILVIVVGTIRLIGSNANNVFSSVASAVQ